MEYTPDYQELAIVSSREPRYPPIIGKFYLCMK